MLTAWLREHPGTLAVKSLTPATQERLLELLQQILSHTEGVNVDREDVWEGLAGAGSLQFGTATVCGPARGEAVGRQVWTSMTTLGNADGRVKRVLVAVHSGSVPALNAGKLAQILALATKSVGDLAETVLGHGHDAQLGKHIRVMLLASWQ